MQKRHNKNEGWVMLYVYRVFYKYIQENGKRAKLINFIAAGFIFEKGNNEAAIS
jgi:hypothetical protein